MALLIFYYVIINCFVKKDYAKFSVLKLLCEVIKRKVFLALSTLNYLMYEIICRKNLGHWNKKSISYCKIHIATFTTMKIHII